MRPKVPIPPTYIENFQRAQHMAILEEEMRQTAAGYEREAKFFTARFEERGDPLYQDAASGKLVHADAYRATIDESVDEVGVKYDEIMGIIEGTRAISRGIEGYRARNQRIKMQNGIKNALRNFGVIGTKSELYKHIYDRFERDPNLIVARLHSEEALPGAERTHSPAKS